MKRILILISYLVVLLSGPASAKGTPDSIRVVTSTGEVIQMSDEQARLWWSEMWMNPDRPEGPLRKPCCGSPRQAAKYTSAVFHQWGRRLMSMPSPYVIIDSTDRLSIFYPSTDSAPGYILIPMLQSGRHSRWPGWTTATEEMERLVLDLSEVERSSAEIDGGTTPREVYTAGGLLLVAGLIYVGFFHRDRAPTSG